MSRKFALVHGLDNRFWVADADILRKPVSVVPTQTFGVIHRILVAQSLYFVLGKTCKLGEACGVEYRKLSELVEFAFHLVAHDGQDARQIRYRDSGFEGAVFEKTVQEFEVWRKNLICNILADKHVVFVHDDYKLFAGGAENFKHSLIKRIGSYDRKAHQPHSVLYGTGNDQTVFPGRSPRIWNIYAKKNPDDVWILIDKRDNTDIQKERMTDENFWTGWWGCQCQHQYFRLEMYENWGDDCFYISEFGFQYNENAVSDDNEITYSVIDASDGEPGNLAPCLFDGNLDTKWCVYKGNKSKTPLHDGKCWYVEFQASKPITPAGFYMTTASDHTVFPDRAPRIWNLYGLKDGWWTLIASYDNTDTPREQMTNLDKWTGNWGINVAPGEYQYFRLEMYENWGGDCFQISEFGFNF